LKAFEEMRQELNNNRRLGLNFMMSVTHDLKTPLTSIRGYLEAIRDGVIESEEETIKIVGILLGKAGLLEERIDEMLDFSRVISCQTEEMGEEYPVREWVDELIQYFTEESLLYRKNFTFKENFPDHLKFTGSEKQLSRAIINLYDNACKHSSENDSILFSVNYDREHQQLILRMEDSGPGVPAAERERIFELFFKKDHGRNTRGMGIGLSSVKFVAGLYRGSVNCRESDLGGACFEFILPVILDERIRS
ncbi:sensor histidine kinase KdpD, partial [Oceanispirochaeta sp.]|jgi:signal transduction histidine kinase|uniref:sensor histidine kinase n=1 Tax=Oceanispirochaeta sp. TaxID=2035350 RepID=UPI002619C619